MANRLSYKSQLVEVYLYKDKDKTPFFYKVVG